MRIDFKSHILPHLVAIAVFLLVTVLFFSPIFFSNQAIQQSDILYGSGAGQEINEYRQATGQEALWTNSMFGGMPAYLINVLYPGEQIVNTLQDIYTLWLPRTPGLVFISMLSFYILLLVFSIRPYLAMAGAIAFGLGTFNLISLEAGHIWKVDAIAYMPLVLAGIHTAMRGHRIWGFTLTALALAFEINSNHLQITYYLLLTVLIYGITMLVYAIRQKALKPFLINAVILVFAALLAVGTTVGRLWNTYQYTQYSTRGPSDLTTAEGNAGSSGLTRDYVFNWSIGKLETFTLLVPDFSGGGSGRGVGPNSETADYLQSQNLNRQQMQQLLAGSPTYWGEKPFTGGPTYAGAVICFLFVLGCFLAPKKHRTWLIIATVFSIVLAWGKHFAVINDLVFAYFPGYAKFRTVEMSMVMALLCIPLLGFLGLEALLEKGWNVQTSKKFWWATGITAGILLTLIVFAGAGSYEAAPDQQYLAQGEAYAGLVEAWRDDRAGMLRSDAFRSLFLVLAVAALLYFYLNKKFGFTLLALGLGALTLFDLWGVGKRYLTDEDYVRESRRENFFNPTEADQYILQDTTQYRVLNLQNTFDNALPSYFHASIGGYHGAKLRRYQDLIDRYLINEINAAVEQLQKGQRNFTNIPVLNMLNAKYMVAGNTRNAVVTNSQALGNAWLVSEVQKVNNPDEAIAALGSLDPARTAVVDVSEFPVTQTTYSSQGTIKLTKYQPNHLTYEANTTGESFAVFSEIYYPDGWKALLDGKEADYIRADYVLRALPLPAGDHTVEFIFDPASYRIGSTVMIVCSIMLLLALVGSIGYTVKKRA